MLQISQQNNQTPSVTLQQLEEKVFRRKPILKYIYKTYGDLSLIDFTKKQFDIPTNDYLGQERKTEVITVIGETVRNLLGIEMQNSVEEQLNQLYTVITADHHGPLTSPGFFNSNLLFSLHAQQNPSLGLKNIIVLSCANVSFDNDSFPRGHLFHTVRHDQPITNQLVFFPRKVRPLTVFRYPAFSQNNIDDAKRRLGDLRREGILQLQEEEQLMNILDEIYAQSDVFASQTFSEQVTKTNYLLWKKIFGNHENVPNLIYIEQEKIVMELLLRYHLHKNTIINQILFDSTMHDLMYQVFNNISGAFSVKKRSGTFLFWGFPKESKYRTQLWKEGNHLVSPDGMFRVELTPDGLQKALENKEIIPSTLLSFIILSFYYGLSLFGGKYQTTYLNQMKHGYNKLLKLSNASEHPMCNLSVPTDSLCITSPTLAHLSYARTNYISATPLDFLMYGGNQYLDTVKEMATTTTMKQAIARLLPQMYEFLYQKDNMQHITTAHIDFHTGFNKQIKPVARVYSK